MAIDTAAKRRSAVATRRLPWFRRFLPAPDGAIEQGDRQQLAFVYAGIEVEEEEEDTALIGPWSHVIPCQSSNSRIETRSANAKINCVSGNKRIET